MRLDFWSSLGDFVSKCYISLVLSICLKMSSVHQGEIFDFYQSIILIFLLFKRTECNELEQFLLCTSLFSVFKYGAPSEEMALSRILWVLKQSCLWHWENSAMKKTIRKIAAVIGREFTELYKSTEAWRENVWFSEQDTSWAELLFVCLFIYLLKGIKKNNKTVKKII